MFFFCFMDDLKKSWVLAKVFQVSIVFYCSFIIAVLIRKTNISPFHSRIISLIIQRLINIIANIKGSEIH